MKKDHVRALIKKGQRLRQHVEKSNKEDRAAATVVSAKHYEQVAKERDELEAERDRLLEALNSRNTLTCVYCGQPYPPGTPTHGSSVLTEHIKVCPKHPLREAEAKIALMEKLLAIYGKLGSAARDYTLWGKQGKLLSIAQDFTKEYDAAMKGLGIVDRRDEGLPNDMYDVYAQTYGKKDASGLEYLPVVYLGIEDLIEIAARRGWDVRLVRPSDKTLQKRQREKAEQEAQR